MPVDLAISYLAPAIKRFGELYPLIDFEMDLTPRRIDLVTDGFDCAIRIGTPPPTPTACSPTLPSPTTVSAPAPA